MFTALELARVALRPRDAYEEVLGADAILGGWHCADAPAGLVAGDVAAWTDRYRGLALVQATAGKRPTYSADGADFHGRAVVKTAATGAKCLHSGVLGANFLTARPWIIWRGRFSALDITNTVQRTLFGFGVAATSDTHYVQTIGTGAQANLRVGSPAVTGTSPMNTAVHTIQLWLDGTNISLVVDGTLFTAASAGNAGNSTGVGIGRSGSTDNQHPDASHAALIVTRIYPGATKAAAIQTLLESDY